MESLFLFLAGLFLGTITGWLVSRKWNAKLEGKARATVITLRNEVERLKKAVNL